MKFKKGAKRAKVNAGKQKTKSKRAKKQKKGRKIKTDKNRLKRKKKASMIRRMGKDFRASKRRKAKKMISKIAEVNENRKNELLGMAVMFKIVKDREIEKTDQFKPNDIKKLCNDFLKKYKKMDEAKQIEFKPLVALAEKKIKQTEIYFDSEKKMKILKKKGEEAKDNVVDLDKKY